jgi:hypothetical protein
LDGGLFVRGKAGVFVEERVDFTLKLADGPVAFEAFVFVKSPLPRDVEADEF